MSNPYKQVIEALSKDRSPDEWRKVVYALAKDHPKIVGRALGVRDWRSECSDLIRQEKTIAAIKTCREITGVSLKDAKDTIDKLRADMGLT